MAERAEGGRPGNGGRPPAGRRLDRDRAFSLLRDKSVTIFPRISRGSELFPTARRFRYEMSDDRGAMFGECVIIIGNLREL